MHFKTSMFYILLSCVCLSFTQLSWAQPKPTQQVSKPDSNHAEKIKDINHLLELMSAKNLGRQVMAQMIQQFRRMNPDMSKEFWDKFLGDQYMNQLVEITVPIYDKYLSHEEVKALITFYSSPIGRRFVHVLPQITQESMVAGQKWGQNVAQAIMKSLQEEKNKASKTTP